MDKARERKRETQRFFVRKVLSSNSENPDASKVFPKHDSSFPPFNLRSNKKGKDVRLSRRTKCFSVSTRKKKKLELDEFLSLSLQLLLSRKVRGKERWSGNLIEGPAKLPWLCGTWRDKVCNS